MAQIGSIDLNKLRGLSDKFIGHNYRWLTAITIVLTLLWLAGRRRRGRPVITTVDELDEELLDDD